MSLLSSFTKGSRLQAAIKTVAEARKSEGGKADQLFIKAYAAFAEILSGDLVSAQSLYNWGFALLQQARTKTGDTAIKLYEEAITKFSFCSTVDPNFLGAAIDGGVALMELARLKAVGIDNVLYAFAKEHFERAEKIHKGSAVYNLACIHSLMGNDDACLSALSNAVKHGSLPSEQEVLSDPDLENVKTKSWFLDFIASLHTIVEKSEPMAEAQVKQKKYALVQSEVKTKIQASVAEVAPIGEAAVIDAEDSSIITSEH
ncbi:MAG: hypothetical protein HOP02_03330 [Methylococcaceae bacterium]|nr:hypothetical protein [Methylococcaceae bacterium]